MNEHHLASYYYILLHIYHIYIITLFDRSCRIIININNNNNLIIIYDYDSNRYFVAFIPPLFIYLFIIINIFGISEIKIFLLTSLTTVQFLYLEKCHSSPRVVIVTVSSKDHVLNIYTFERIILPSYLIYM